jgi:MoxR-like ATPase
LDINEKDILQVIETVRKIESEVAKQMVGQKDLIRQVLICILAGGNVLLEGVPGLGKTRLVNTLGQVMGLEFSRIQFTPDLMPADVVGTNIITKDQSESGMFKFQQGPIFSNIVLADEINRATPKTQSAMLQAMQEKVITVANTTYQLPRPFFVLATQNPIEMEGTYPLPEAQLDRFLFKLDVPFPSLEELTDIVTLTTGSKQLDLHAVTGSSELLNIMETVKEIPVAEPVLEFALKLTQADPRWYGLLDVTLDDLQQSLDAQDTLTKADTLRVEQALMRCVSSGVTKLVSSYCIFSRLPPMLVLMRRYFSTSCCMVVPFCVHFAAGVRKAKRNTRSSVSPSGQGLLPLGKPYFVVALAMTSLIFFA